MDKIEYVIDPETGKYTKITVNGKMVKAGSLRGWNKAIKTPFFQMLKEGRTFRNRFSGVGIFLNELEGTIYNWCVAWYSRYEQSTPPTSIEVYDDMKYFLLELNPDAYMTLLD